MSSKSDHDPSSDSESDSAEQPKVAKRKDANIDIKVVSEDKLKEVLGY